MKDALGSQVLGGTKWKRFALVMVPTVGIAGAMTVAMANGVLASSFAVSGQRFEVSADQLDGTTFAQSGDVIIDANGKAHAVAVAGIKTRHDHQHVPVGRRPGAGPGQPVGRPARRRRRHPGDRPPTW